jgi:hypothetical protein
MKRRRPLSGHGPQAESRVSRRDLPSACAVKLQRNKRHELRKPSRAGRGDWIGLFTFNNTAATQQFLVSAFLASDMEGDWTSTPLARRLEFHTPVFNGAGASPLTRKRLKPLDRQWADGTFNFQREGRGFTEKHDVFAAGFGEA